MGEERVTASQPRRYIIFGLGGIALLCLFCCAALLVLRPAPGGLGVMWCAGVVTAPRWQVGVAWVSPLSSYLPPLTLSPHTVCVTMQQSRLPRRLSGEWVFPP